MFIAVCILYVMYTFLILLLMAGWTRATTVKKLLYMTDRPFITIIVPARNEENNVMDLLQDIASQDYDSWEAIIVDDHSEDATLKVVEKFIMSDERFRLIESPGSGKKTAIAHGVMMSKGSIILTTDADCHVPSNWVSGIAQFFSDNDIHMVFGGVRMNAVTFSENLQAIEFAALIASGAGSAGLGVPTICNGANLSFRKAIFKEVGGYQGNLAIPSGDDEFLMRKVEAKFPGSICFAGIPSTVVTTAPNKGFRQFVNQRIRWAGKWRLHSGLASRLLAVFIFSFHLTTLALPVMIVSGTVDLLPGLSLLFSRMLVEFLFIRSTITFLQIRWSWGSFLLLQLIYPAYVVGIALLSTFSSFEWKGRKLKSLTFSSN